MRVKMTVKWTWETRSLWIQPKLIKWANESSKPFGESDKQRCLKLMKFFQARTTYTKKPTFQPLVPPTIWPRTVNWKSDKIISVAYFIHGCNACSTGTVKRDTGDHQPAAWRGAKSHKNRISQVRRQIGGQRITTYHRSLPSISYQKLEQHRQKRKTADSTQIEAHGKLKCIPKNEVSFSVRQQTCSSELTGNIACTLRYKQ